MVSRFEIHEAESLDRVLRRAAAIAPGRAALRFGAGAMSYAELDAAVNGFAAALAGNESGAVVGVTAAPLPAFPLAYFGALRAGRVCVVVDPHLAEDELDHLLGVTGVTVLAATAGMADPLRRIRLRLPDLNEVVYLDRPGDQGAQTVANLAKAYARWQIRSRPDPDSVACLRFSGVAAARSEPIPLTHRNLAAGAAQAAVAYGLDPGSTIVHHLPAYEPVYLNASIHAAATQVLCADPDPAGGVALAARQGATHYCGQPVRLARLAADPRGTDWRMPTVRVVLSGGSVLAPAAAARVRQRLGAPLIQWYGTPEAPLTHCDRLDRPTPGSVGRPVPGTECRVVDADGLHPLPPGIPGEVQVRGPQVAAGTAGPDGWLRTGDFGYVDDEGVLFLVDPFGAVSRDDRPMSQAGATR